jgi:hypothetical protein
MELNFLDIFSKNIQMSKLMEIRPVEANLIHTDGRTDGRIDMHDESNIRNFVKAPKKNKR